VSAVNIGMQKRTRTIHFVGIGGIGMSGIAEVLLNLGYNVTGSDAKASETTRRLESIGGSVKVGHHASNVGAADVVVVSSAVAKDNVEIVEARRLKVPVIRRAEMLAELMRLKFGIAVGGTHGKTTTTSLVAAVLSNAGLDPTIVVGGKVNKLGTTARLGQGPYLVAEADESDGSFLTLSPTIACVTNIDPEHLDHYEGGIAEVHDAFVAFVNRIPFYGLAVLCVDHPGVQAILPRVERRAVTYGLSPRADVAGRNLVFERRKTSFELIKRGVSSGRFEMNMLGEHNVENALAVLAIADELGIADEVARQALAEFDGVDRRFSIRGVANDVIVVDDYGHHPAEIRATLAGARRAYPDRRFVVAFQPHRFTRTRDLMEEFTTAFHEADVLFVLPIYAASEQPIEGVTSDRLIEEIAKRGHRDVRAAKDVDHAIELLATEARPKDLVIAFGAGSIGAAGNAVTARLLGMK
jgi:UDP-N-acetylmuramate--alanine ligase